MTERLLQFIWQFQYFNRNELCTCSGEELLVFFPGHFNPNQGPDFSTAKIKLQQTIWAGSVELHLRTSDWLRHKHTADANYQQVILHVVWEHDVEVNSIPVLELKDRVSRLLLSRYESLMNAVSFIPCENSIHTVPELHFTSWKERLLAERLLRKSATIEQYLQQNNFHWEETCWWLIARNFGMKVNADAFEAVARSIPLTLLARQKHQLHRLEALLLGQAGLLERKFEESYPQLLQREYQFLKQKHGLQPILIPLLFLRMRPGNFPTVRLAQLAMLLYESVHLFSKIKEASTLGDVKALLNVTANDYWHYHYRMDEPSPFKKKKMGESMIDSVIINTVAPLLFCYGHFYDENHFKQKALEWLEGLRPETNVITRGFTDAGIDNKSAFDSQALLELKNSYCDKKKCLDCGVGNILLKKNSE